MPTQTTTKRIPNPLYAAAGAGDLAYRELRRLPERVAELRDRVVELGPAVTDAVSDAVTDARRGADLNRLRRVARRNAEAFVSGVEAAQSSAVKVYRGLVRRGERLVSRNVRGASARVAVDPAGKTVRAQVGVSPEPGRPTATKAPAKRAGKPAAKRTTSATAKRTSTVAKRTSATAKRTPATTKRTTAAAKRTTTTAKRAGTTTATGRARKAPAKRTAAK